MTFADELAGNARYRLEERIGAGGMGTVYRAYDMQRDTTVALKMLTYITPDLLAKFKKEFRALADVHHPNLITLYDLEQHESKWFFTMELVDGSNFIEHVRKVTFHDTATMTHPTLVDLTDSTDFTDSTDDDNFDTLNLDANLVNGEIPNDRVRLKRGTIEPPGAVALDIKRLRSILRQLVEGIHALHSTGQLHCDLKPSNVLVTDEGRVVILDFGLVTELGVSRVIKSGAVSGTPAYMAPEQARLKDLSPAADWYAVGGMLYTCLTGKAPFTGAVVKMLFDKQNRMPEAPKKLISAIPDDLNQLTMSLLAPSPKDRPTGKQILEIVGAQRNRQSVLISRGEADELIFVGREAQLQALKDAQQTVSTSHGVSVYVGAESGLGKTALIRRFRNKLKSEGGIVLKGRCYERESVPFKALDAVIDDLSAYLLTLSDQLVESLLPSSTAALAQIFPVLGRVKIVDRMKQVDAQLQPQELRRLAASALREILARIADKVPLAIFIDDLQWGDVDSAQFLATLVRPPEAPRFLLLMSYRSNEADFSPLLKVLRTRESGTSLDGDVRTIEVDALTEDEAAELAHFVLGKKQGEDPRQARQIAQEAHGHPYFVRVLAEVVASRGENFVLGSLSLDDVLWNEIISKLAPASIELLSTVAIAGRPISWDLVHNAALNTRTGDTNIVMLRKLHLIRTTGADHSDQVEAYHDRIRETVINNMSKDDQRKKHRRLGELLENEEIRQIEALAYHFYAAGLKSKACRYAKEAALRARKATAFDREAEYIARVIELEPPQEAANALFLYESLGIALVDAGKTAQGANALLKAAEYAPDLKSRSLKRQATQYLLESGRLEDGYKVAAECLAAYGMTIPASAREATFNMLKNVLRIKLRGGLEKFTERAEKDVAPEELEKIDICWAIASGSALGNQTRTLDFQYRALLHALKAGEPVRIGRSLTVEAGYFCAKNGKIAEKTSRILDLCMDIATRENNYENMGFTYIGLGMSGHLCGKWRTSSEHLEAGNKVWRTRCTGMSADVIRGETFRIHNLHMLGEIRELTRTLPNILANAIERDDRWGIASLRTACCITHWLALDDVATATENCGDLRTVKLKEKALTVQHVWHMISNSYTSIYVQDPDWIQTIAATISGSIPAIRRGMLYVIQIIRTSVSDAVIRLSLAALSMGLKDAPYETLIAQHIKKLRKEKQPQALGYAAAGSAGLARHQKRLEDEQKHLTDAIKWYREAEMALCEHACLWRLGELVGGDQGAQWQQLSFDWGRAQAIEKPKQLFRAFVPYDLVS